MAIQFPEAPANDDIYNNGGTQYRYNAEKNIWLAISSSAGDFVPVTGGDGGGGTTTYDDMTALIAATGMTTGDQAFVQENNKLYLYNGAGWYLVATLENSQPTTISGVESTYSLANDGTATTITAVSEDPDGFPLTWSYAVTTGSLGSTATVSQTDNVFTITPSTDQANAGEFSITFSVTDGATGVVSAVSAFTLSFGVSFDAITLTQTLDNPNSYDTAASDSFGSAIAQSGDLVSIVASGEDEAGYTNTGKIYIYNVTTGTLLRTISNPNPAVVGSTVFGANHHMVDMDGDYLIVGSQNESDASGNTVSGQAYIFNVTTGALLHTLSNPNAYDSPIEDRFGNAVAISGNYAIVGAYTEDDAVGLGQGKAYIFNVTTGALLHTLDNPGTYVTANANFGWRVDIDGNYAIVSAGNERNSANENMVGAVYIYNVTTGALIRSLANPNPHGAEQNDKIGAQVCLSGDYGIFTTYTETSDDFAGASEGYAYIFNVTTGALLHTLKNPNSYGTGASDRFGQFVAMDGNFAVISAFAEDGPLGISYGYAYIYDVTTGTLLHSIANPNDYDTPVSDSFGWAVSMFGEYIVIGASGEDDANGITSGKAYIFKGS
jgi:hypothetical protein